MASIRYPENIAKLTKASSTTVSLAASTINIGGQQYRTTNALTLSTAIVGAGGVDAAIQANSLYYVYAVVASGSPALIASTSSTAPSGFALSRLVGHFATDNVPQIAQVFASGQYDIEVTLNKKNYLLNSNFDIWQRGTGPFTTNNSGVYYVADRWGTHLYQQGSISRQGFSGGGQHPGSGSLYVLRCAGDGSTNMRMQTAQAIEDINLNSLRGKWATLTGYVRFSAATMSTGASLGAWGATIGYSNSSGNGPFISTNYLADASPTFYLQQGSLPTTWKKFQVTLFIPISAQNVAAVFQFSSLATPPASDYFELSQVQITEGAIAYPFNTAGATTNEELALCQRYYETNVMGAARSSGSPIWGNSYPESIYVFWKVPKRNNPVVTYQGGSSHAVNINADVSGANFSPPSSGSGGWYLYMSQYTANSEL